MPLTRTLAPFLQAMAHMESPLLGIAGWPARMLMEALDASGRQKLPDSAAKAQVMWECWFEELEESRQPPISTNAGKTSGAP